VFFFCYILCSSVERGGGGGLLLARLTRGRDMIKICSGIQLAVCHTVTPGRSQWHRCGVVGS
jgi:hypothetical protein